MDEPSFNKMAPGKPWGEAQEWELGQMKGPQVWKGARVWASTVCPNSAVFLPRWMPLSDHIKEKARDHMRPDSVHREFCMKTSSVQIAEKTGAEGDEDLSNPVSSWNSADEKWSFIKVLQGPTTTLPQMSRNVFPRD